jgi:hypothetical protein
MGPAVGRWTRSRSGAGRSPPWPASWVSRRRTSDEQQDPQRDRVGHRVLEPGVGSGTFLATAPAAMDLDPVGVEVDPVTASIAQALHPEAMIRAESYATTRYPDG